MRLCILSRALSTRVGVAHGKYDGLLVGLSHGLQNVRCEQAALDACQPNQYSWLHLHITKALMMHKQSTRWLHTGLQHSRGSDICGGLDLKGFHGWLPVCA